MERVGTALARQGYGKRLGLMRAGFVLLLGVLLLLPWTARAEDRIALVIGNGKYTGVRPLSHSVNDAQQMAEALTRLGFEVTSLSNAPKQVLTPLLESFSLRAGSADLVLFYYSGHAFRLEGENHLVPTDADLTNPETLRDETWAFSAIVRRLTGEGRQTIYLLDANRTSPLPLSVQGEGHAGGLAKPDSGAGSFVGFATQPGATAPEGASGETSPFTQALLSHLETPGISISDLMIRVRNQVVAKTYGAQVPWDQSSLRAQVYLRPEIEQGPMITQADLEAINGLDESSIRNVIGALAENGITLVIEDVPDEELVAMVDSTPNPIVEIGEAGEDGEQTARVGSRSVETGQATLADKVAAAEALVATARRKTDTANAPSEEQLAAVPVPEDLPRAVQEELARVGCHRATVDGIWGRVSRISLLRYYAARGEVTAEQARAEPSADAFKLLSLEPGVVCTGVEAAPVLAAAKPTTRVVRKAPAASQSRTSTTPKISTKPTVSESGKKVPAKINRLSRGALGG